MTNDKDKRIKRLEEKVEKLENAVRMPTRREAIAAAGIGVAGVAGFSSGASAASPSDAVGPVYFEQIGDSDNPVSEFYVDTEYQAESDQNPIFDSVTTGQAIIGGHRSDDPKELLAYENLSGESVSVNVEGVSCDDDQSIMIEVLRYVDDEDNANNNLNLRTDATTGSYKYVLEDETLSSTLRTSENEWVLWEPTENSSLDGCTGAWTINVGFPGSTGSIYGRASAYLRNSGRSLAKGWRGTGSNTAQGDFDVTLEAQASAGETVELEAAVWKTRNRGGI